MAYSPNCPTVLDAYKNYLYAKGSTAWQDVNKLEPGDTIPLADLLNDIEVIKKTIATCLKFGLPTTEEMAKLGSLVKLRDDMGGKYSSDSKNDPSGYIPGVFKYDVSKQFIKNLKVKTPFPANTAKNQLLIYKEEPKTVALKIGRASIEQALIMRIGMMSNCNVSINTLISPDSYRESVLLTCGICKARIAIDDLPFLSGAKDLPDVLGRFCTTHRHDPKSEEVVGRKFREEDD